MSDPVPGGGKGKGWAIEPPLGDSYQDRVRARIYGGPANRDEGDGALILPHQHHDSIQHDSSLLEQTQPETTDTRTASDPSHNWSPHLRTYADNMFTTAGVTPSESHPGLNLPAGHRRHRSRSESELDISEELYERYMHRTLGAMEAIDIAARRVQRHDSLQ